MSAPIPPPQGMDRGLKWLLIAVVGGLGCLGMLFLGGIVVAIAIPNYLGMQLRAKRSELPTNLDSIRVAEMAYYAEWDTYLPCGGPPPDPASLRTQPRAWEEDAAAPCFRDLGWSAAGPVRGVYWVEVTQPGKDGVFTAYATADLDGDGEAAVYSATAGERAVRVTEDSVF
ncbi:hypothetical protein L6R50_06345 [Myxococcota bacterium]|nr:hypothetical protein [Myxococcota bacterium]